MVWEVKIILILIGVWQALRQAYWWQVKEYRWDRWKTWVKYNEGWRDLVKIDVRWPEWTARAMLVAGTGIVGAILGQELGPITGILGTYLGVVWTYPVMEWQRTRIMDRAKKRVERFRPKVVSVNGSYGKSSSKDFLVQIIGKKFRTATTEGSENSELGVARRILEDVNLMTEVMVLEMGAYKRGEIARMCRMARPDVALVTGIGLQHIDLFGGLENSQKAEFETIESLPEKGVGVFNGDSPDEQPLVEWAKMKPIKIVVYSTSGKIGKVTIAGFELEKVWVPIRGVHFAQNILGAMAVASELGMTEKEIKTAIEQLQQPEKSLQLHKLKCGALVIDNSYNTNKEGFAASVDYLKLYKGRKFVITPGIIELGEKTTEVHKWLGTKLQDIDGVWVSRPGVEAALQDGGVKIMTQKIEEVVGKDDTLLIEGRIAPVIKQRLLSL